LTAARLAIRFAPLDGLPLVVDLLALGQPDRHLHVAVPEVEPGGDERHPALGGLADQFSNLLAVQQQLAPPCRVVVRVATMAVRVDVDVVQPDFAAFHAREAVAEVHGAFADGLHLGADEHDARLERLEDVVVVKRLPVLGDVLLRRLALALRFHLIQTDSIGRPSATRDRRDRGGAESTCWRGQ
jgi:hypothetical protein